MSIVALIYGINYFTLKAAFREDVSPFAVLTIRNLFATVFFVSFYLLFIRERIQSKADYFRLLIAAVFGICLNQNFFIWGLSKTTEVNAAVLMVTTPVFVFLVAALLREERFDLIKILGLFISFIGAALLIIKGRGAVLSFGGDTLSGDIMIGLNAASYGVYLVLVRPLMVKYNPFTIVAWVFFFGAFWNIPIGFSEMIAIDYEALSGKALFGVIFLTFGATITVYLLNSLAMKRVKASAVGMYIYFQPVFVTLLSAIIFQGSVTLEKIAYILLIFVGVYLVMKKRNSVRV